MDLLKNTRPTWVEINLDNLAHNIREVKRVIKKDTEILAVVKADAYGHGVIESANVFLNNGANRLAVTALSEAIQLRKNNINVPIIIFAYTPLEQSIDLLQNDVIQTIYSFEQAKAISKAGCELHKDGKVHIKLDTGMSRIGFLPNEDTIKEIVKISKLPNLMIEGIYTHFARADEESKEFTKKQYDRFNWVIDKLQKRGINIPIKHVSNSAAIIDCPEYNFDMVRAGIMLYGLYPSGEVDKDNVDLRPAMTFKTRVVNIKKVKKGTGISYGHRHVTQEQATIGTLPVGYADGFTRILSGNAEVSIKGKRVPVVGNICMGQCMVNLSSIDNVEMDDEVVLFGDGSNNSLHIDEIADKLNTINYEIVCMVSRRVPRVYIKNGEIVKVNDYLL